MENHSTYTQIGDYVACNDSAVYIGIPMGAYLTPSNSGLPEVYIPKTDLDSNLVPENIVSGKSIHLVLMVVHLKVINLYQVLEVLYIVVMFIVEALVHQQF